MNKLKRMLTHETTNSFEPVVMLPAWKSVIVDWLTILSFGLCRWRWGGITLEEWYNGFTTVRFFADDTVGPEEVKICEELAEHFGCRMNEETSVSNRTVEALKRFTEQLKSGEPIPAKRVNVEQTPDGPLTIVEDIVFRGQK